MYACMYVYVCIYMYVVCMYVYMYVCMYGCMHLCVEGINGKVIFLCNERVITSVTHNCQYSLLFLLIYI